SISVSGFSDEDGSVATESSCCLNVVGPKQRQTIEGIANKQRHLIALAKVSSSFSDGGTLRGTKAIISALACICQGARRCRLAIGGQNPPICRLIDERPAHVHSPRQSACAPSAAMAG